MNRNLTEKPPLPLWPAVKSLAMCAAATAGLLARRRIHLPKNHVGQRVRFTDGTEAVIYRETTVDQGPVRDPAALVVEFRLRLIRGAIAHALFRAESLLNTPLFVGFPGYVSKLWLGNDERNVYRGIYEWDGPARAEHYARSLWWVLALVSVRGSIHYRVLPGLHRDDLLRRPDVAAGESAWLLPAQPVPSFA